MTGTPTDSDVPSSVRARFAHARIELLAQQAGADLLHLKGAALDPTLRWPGREGGDADVLLRPEHLTRFTELLAADGWHRLDDYATGSPFGHSAAWTHPTWGALDVHRAFPGLGPTPAVAFERLWASRQTTPIAGMPCTVPDRYGQALVMLLHAVRSGDRQRAGLDIRAVRDAFDPAGLDRLRRFARDVDAELPLALAFDEDVAPFAHRPDYDLWLAVSGGGTRTQEWRARIKAAHGIPAKVALIARIPLPNRATLYARHGREPTRAELWAEVPARVIRGARDLSQTIRDRRAHR